MPNATSGGSVTTVAEGSVTDSPALSTTSSTQPVPIIKKESNLRSWFTSSSSAAVPTNSPVNLSTSPPASGGRGSLLDALGGSTDRPMSPAAAGDSSASSSAQSTAKTSKSFYGDFLNKTNHHHQQQQQPPQNKQQPQMKQEQESQQQQQQKSSRRTTSLLNLFMSNSQGNFFVYCFLFTLFRLFIKSDTSSTHTTTHFLRLLVLLRLVQIVVQLVH